MLFEALSKNGKPRILGPPQMLTEVTFEEVIVSYIHQDNKQLLHEVEHDIMNYQNLVSVLSASAFGFGR